MSNIENIPKINGPNFGGVIYGLQLTQNYSQSPSKLKLNIVSNNGTYGKVRLGVNNKTQVSLDSFSFNGFPLSYNLTESANEKILEVELVDNSVILDRHYVTLWKPGFFDEYGTRLPSAKSFKEFDFQDQPTLVPILEQDADTGTKKIKFTEKPLPPQKIFRKIFQCGKEGFVKKDNIICIGKEMFRNSECDISSTYYDFPMFVKAVGRIDGLRNIGSLEISQDYQATYEGTLREVLQSWCSDFGYDFYWDYTNDQIVFYDVSVGITPNLNISKNIPSIIEYSESDSIEGTFIQYGASYTAYPKQSIKSLNSSYAFNIITTIDPYPLEYFLTNNGEKPRIRLRDNDDSESEEEEGEGEGGLWGGNRTKNEFLSAALLGYISQSLRNIYSMFHPPHWEVMGMKVLNVISSDEEDQDENDNEAKANVISILQEKFPEQLKKLQEIDNEELSNYNLAAVIYDEGKLNKWQQLEQDSLSILGRFYRHLGNSETFFYCTKTSITEINCTVDPESQNYEGDNVEFQGLKLFERQGQMGRSSENISNALELNLEENAKSLESCQNAHVDLTEDLRSAMGGENINRANTLVLFPNKNLFGKLLQNFEIEITRRNNQMEKTVIDLVNEQEKQQKNNCPDLEETLKNINCISAEDEAKEKALKELQKETAGNDEQAPISGLANKTAWSITLSIFSKRETLHAPSDSSYFAVYKYEINYIKISETDADKAPERIFFKTEASSFNVPNNVIGIDFTSENVTDTQLDNFLQKRKLPLPMTPTFSNTMSQKKYKIVFAGSPRDVPLSPGSGLESMNISYSSDGFTTTLEYGSRPPKRNKRNLFLREIQSQFNRISFNSV
jgi:hypothetical protein